MERAIGVTIAMDTINESTFLSCAILSVINQSSNNVNAIYLGVPLSVSKEMADLKVNHP